MHEIREDGYTISGVIFPSKPLNKEERKTNIAKIYTNYMTGYPNLRHVPDFKSVKSQKLFLFS